MSDDREFNDEIINDRNEANQVEIVDEQLDQEVDEIKKAFYETINTFKNLNDIRHFFSGLHKGLIRLRLILLISESDDKNEILDEFNSLFRVTKLKDLYKLDLLKDKELQREPNFPLLGYLWFLPESSSSILFTFTTKKQLLRYFFNSFVSKSRVISPLWINQETTMKLIKDLQLDKEASLKKWKGEYSPLNNKKSKIRPYIEREISYYGNDAYNSLLELKDLYGVNIEYFTMTLFDLGYFSFNRKFATLTLRQGDLDVFILMSKWLFENTNSYMNEVRRFKKILFNSIFSKRSIIISNDLSIKFKEELSNEILNEILKRIKKSNDLKLNYVVDFDQSKDSIYNIKIINKNSKGSFKVIITKNSAHIFQIFNANFIGAIPFLDIIDFCQPRNEIFVKVP
ncbi:hypothetical protein LCGC14_1411620 [marine sediment metagenome]|uniref:Uncharacterized protein n=1 Tax=marine sediment metagenome TaxID=412755 RepID=A0A0F9M9I2_9ZZZZ